MAPAAASTGTPGRCGAPHAHGFPPQVLGGHFVGSLCMSFDLRLGVSIWTCREPSPGPDMCRRVAHFLHVILCIECSFFPSYTPPTPHGCGI